MAQLAERLAQVLREYGWDPAAHGDLQTLAALEGSDPKASQELFHELRRGFAVRRRADLLRSLRAFPFVRDAPPADARGMGLKEVESEIRTALRSLAHARAASDALAEAGSLRRGLALRAAPPAPEPAPAPWDALAPVAESAEAHRRAVAREARVEARALEAKRRAARLVHHRVELPDLSSAALPDAADVDAALEPVEARLKDLEALEEAFEAASAFLKAPEVRAWKAESRKALEREARALLAKGDSEGLRALARRAEALRVEAAATASKAARARRSGRAVPEAERRPGDPLDPYG